MLWWHIFMRDLDKTFDIDVDDENVKDIFRSCIIYSYFKDRTRCFIGHERLMKKCSCFNEAQDILRKGSYYV